MWFPQLVFIRDLYTGMQCSDHLQRCMQTEQQKQAATHYKYRGTKARHSGYMNSYLSCQIVSGWEERPETLQEDLYLIDMENKATRHTAQIYQNSELH